MNRDRDFIYPQLIHCDTVVFFRFTEDNGITMYECYKYNNSEPFCSGKSYEQCRKPIDCNSSQEDQKSQNSKNQHCFVVFSKDNKVLSAGCNQYSKDAVDPCDSDKCIGTIKGSLYHCCCSNSLCNREFIYPLRLPLELQPPNKPQESGNNLLSGLGLSSSLLWSMIPFVVIITLISAFIFKHKKRQRRTNSLELRNNDNHVTVPLRADYDVNAGANHIHSNNIIYHSIHRPDTILDANNLEQQNEKRINLSSIKLLEEVGSGRFGTVHRALLDETIEIAVKIASHNDHQCWFNETQIYCTPGLKHPNILNFIHSDEHLETDSYWLVVEYASKGSLYNFLKEYTVNWKEFIHIALGIANGLSHLHDAEIGHRDFKSKNVLLKNDLTPCITDFGVAAILDINTGSQTDLRKKYVQVGTPRYMAPEVLECSVTFTKTSFTKIDVYALSLVMWELITRCFPIPVYATDDHSSSLLEAQNHTSSPRGQVASVVEPMPYKLPFEELAGPHPTIEEMRQIVVVNKLRPPLKEEWRSFPAAEFCRAMKEGWEYDHDARISASCFAERVESLTEYSL